MGLTYATEVDAPIETVFAWHQRSGAITRLTPPWQPVGVDAEAASVRDGTAVLSVPGPVGWVARHDPDGYDPPRQFVDQLATPVLGSLMRWRHTHQFTDVSSHVTKVTDRVETRLPAAVLRSMFAYRHRQLAGDLTAQEHARRLGDRPRTVAITGSSGLVGTALAAYLSTAGHTVIRLVRRMPSHSGERQWRPDDPATNLLEGVDAVVHLAGAPIAGRFTDGHKHRVYDSRVGPTARLAEAAAAAKVDVFVCASAIGYYGPDRGDDRLVEDSPPGDSLLADVVTAWEGDTSPARDAGVRTVQVRTGLVQSPAGGMLRLLYPLFVAGLGGRLGDGMQWMSWIGIDDLVDIYHRTLYDDALSGPVNAVAPTPVRNDEYTRALARVLRRPARLPVPDLAPQLLLGAEGATELARANQRVHPGRLHDQNHTFRHPTIDKALAHVLGRTPPACT